MRNDNGVLTDGVFIERVLGGQVLDKAKTRSTDAPEHRLGSSLAPSVDDSRRYHEEHLYEG